jgi:hypothetical protein
MEKHCIFNQNNYGIVLYPFLIRSLDALEFLQKEVTKDSYDITTPYGYGGPLVKVYDNPKIEGILRKTMWIGADYHDIFCLLYYLIVETKKQLFMKAGY